MSDEVEFESCAGLNLGVVQTWYEVVGERGVGR